MTLGAPMQQHQSGETTNWKLTLKETLLQAQKCKVCHSRFCFVTLTQTLKARVAAAARAAAARAAAARAAAAATRRGH